MNKLGHNEILTDIQIQVLNGHLLGDGNLSKPMGNGDSRFSIERAYADKDYLLWSVKHFENFIYSSGLLDRQKIIQGKTYELTKFSTKHSSIFKEYYHKWYPEPKRQKIIPLDLVLTPLTIAVWFCDDGSIKVSKNKYLTILLATNCFTYDNVYFLQQQLNKLYGDSFKIYNQRKQQFLIECSKRDIIYNFFDDIKYDFPPMERKYEIFRSNLDITFPILSKWICPNIDFLKKEPKNNPPCRYCGGTNVRKGGTSKNKQTRYLCKDCNKTYMAPIDYISLGIIERLPCIYCQSHNIILFGYNKIGERKYKCKDCNKTYMELDSYKYLHKNNNGK